MDVIYLTLDAAREQRALLQDNILQLKREISNSTERVDRYNRLMNNLKTAIGLALATIEDLDLHISELEEAAKNPPPSAQ